LERIPNTGDGKTKRHLDNLRNITAKLIREESLVEHSSIDGPPITNNKSKSRYRVRTSDPSETPVNSIAIPEPFQKLKPWLECTSRMVELRTKPLVQSKTPRQILSPSHSIVRFRNDAIRGRRQPPSAAPLKCSPLKTCATLDQKSLRLWQEQQSNPSR